MNNNEKHAYAAGLIDGEGSVMLIRTHKGKFRVPTISMTSTTRGLVLFMQRLYGGKIKRQPVRDEFHKPAWIWEIKYNACLSCAEHVLPYCIEDAKVRRLQLLTTRYKETTVRNGKYTEEAHRAKLLFEEEFMSIRS